MHNPRFSHRETLQLEHLRACRAGSGQDRSSLDSSSFSIFEWLFGKQLHWYLTQPEPMAAARLAAGSHSQHGRFPFGPCLEPMPGAKLSAVIASPCGHRFNPGMPADQMNGTGEFRELRVDGLYGACCYAPSSCDCDTSLAMLDCPGTRYISVISDL